MAATFFERKREEGKEAGKKEGREQWRDGRREKGRTQVGREVMSLYPLS